MFLTLSKKENTQKSLRDEFFEQVLNWNPDWFRDKKYQNKIPAAVNNIKLTAGKLHYNNIKEYQDVMFPQLIHEYWCTLQRDYQTFFKEKRDKTIRVENHHLSLNTQELIFSHWTISFCCCDRNKLNCIHPRQGDLVELLDNGKKYFGYVLCKDVLSRKHGMGRRYQLSFSLLLGADSKKILIRSQLRNPTLTPITFLDGYLCMVDALDCLETFPLSRFILSPIAEQYRMPLQLKLNLSDIPTKTNPNPSQLRVISGIIEAIEQAEPKICLVQGPPGTGKSNIIVNIIASMIKRNNNIQFLVCAASNKAVDSLALQLMKIQPTLKDQNIPFQIVRVGNEEKVDQDVKKILLYRLTCTLNEKYRTRKESECEPEDVLMTSQVITSTLTSCYTNSLMRKCFNENSCSELICIVDEAAQANELLTMVPLLLGVKFLFLVGDPKQLEPIVLSQNAKQYGFDSSLFARAQKIFKIQKINPIVMLDIQYRMEKSISCWPNKYFYNGRLKDASSVNPLGICHYKLFNHNYSQNLNGYANEDEAQLVVKLIRHLEKKINFKKSSKITIGVITPYHEQRELIQKLLDDINDEFPTKYQVSNKKSQKPSSHQIDCQDIDGMIETSTKLLKDLKLHENPILEFGNNVDIKMNESTPFSTELLKNLQLDFLKDNYYIDDNDNIIYPKNTISQELFNNLRLELGFQIEKNNLNIEVKTVDSFQGSERDIIIMSCVRSNGLGFTRNPNRLNVSMTRAKHSFIMFGNFKAFQKDSMWSNLIQDATKRNVLIQINDFTAEWIFNKHVSN